MFPLDKVNMVYVDPTTGKDRTKPSSHVTENPTLMVTEPLKPHFSDDVYFATKLGLRCAKEVKVKDEMLK